MNDEKWEQLAALAKAHFSEVELKSEPDEDGKGTVDTLTFTKARDRYRVVRENRPVVLDKKTFYSHRAGDTARTEYVLSDSEFSHKLKFYREDELGDWEEINPGELGLE